MIGDVIQLVGWVGLLIFGMLAMTDGLKALAGDAINRILFRFTRSPWSGALTGAVATAIAQSSSVVTVATVGFVGAGLLSFPQALGIVWGANIGTTLRGWLVALIGFRAETATAMFLLLPVGALLRLFGKPRTREAGWAIAGFALIFIAIEQMRIAMLPFQAVVTPESFPADSIGGRALLVLMGIVITLVTQSSSAGVAMALTAINAGTIGFPQAAAMVIGMDIGTTSTSALATLGGSPETKRTGFAHVVYNLLTGIAAFALLPLYTTLVDRWFDGATRGNPELALVGFHTTFNFLGVVAVLPFTRSFAVMMNRIFADEAPSLTSRLDPILTTDIGSSTLAVWLTVRDVSVALLRHLEHLLRGSRGGTPANGIVEIERAIDETRRYADRSWSSSGPVQAIHIDPYRQSTMHCLDHLERLAARCRQERRSNLVLDDPSLRRFAEPLAAELATTLGRLQANDPLDNAAKLADLRSDLQAAEPGFRRQTLDRVGPGMRFDDAIARLDGERWLRRVTYHVWRIVHHLSQAEQGMPDRRGGR